MKTIVCLVKKFSAQAVAAGWQVQAPDRDGHVQTATEPTLEQAVMKIAKIMEEEA